MDLRPYLPSARFSALVIALGLSVGLIYGAERLSAPPEGGAYLASASPQQRTSDWQQAFASSTLLATSQSIQAQAQKLVAGAQTDNLTDSIGRSLLINLSAAAGQGLSGSSATQDQILSSALATVQSAPASVPYAQSDIPAAPETLGALGAWGNALAGALATRAQADYDNSMLAVSLAIDTGDASSLAKLSGLANEYRALAKTIAAIPAPPSVAALELTIANDYALMAGVQGDMAAVLGDPLRGLAGIRDFNQYETTNAQVFTNIAGILQKDGILFKKSDPGYAWSALLALEGQVQAQNAANTAAAAAPATP